NPWMDPDAAVDPRRARDQWDTLKATIEAAGASVETITPVEGLPDMVYVMNYALVDGTEVLLGNFRFDERRPETEAAEKWFADHGYVIKRSADSGRGCFEPGDAFLFGDKLVVAYGPRTDEAMLEVVAAELDVEVLPVKTISESLYHIDLSFCPL